MDTLEEVVEKISHHIINELIYSEFIDELIGSEVSKEDILTFTNNLKNIPNYIGIKDAIITSLFEKIKEAADFIPSLFHFRKLIKVLLDISNNDPKLVDALATFFLTSSGSSEHYFLLLEEILSRNMSTERVEPIFMSIIGIHPCSVSQIDQFLKIIRQDHTYLVKRLLDASMFACLRHFIGMLAGQTYDQILEKNIIPPLLQFNGSSTQYLTFVWDIIGITPKYCKVLLEEHQTLPDCLTRLERFINNNHSSNMNAIKNYISYLVQRHPLRVSQFEEKFLIWAWPDLMLDYALQVPTSNKRKVLCRLVDSKNEKVLVNFIDNFPVYSSLLPML